MIAEFDMETWQVRACPCLLLPKNPLIIFAQRAIEVFNIDKSIIPTRPSVPPEEKYPKFSGKGRRPPTSEDEEVPLPSQTGEED